MTITVPNPYPSRYWKKITQFRYTTPLILRRNVDALLNRPDPDKDAYYVVHKPYTVRYRLDNKNHSLTVPAGFLTDLVSAPRLAAWFKIRRVGPYLEAAIVHDYLYVAWQYLKAQKNRKARKKDWHFSNKLMLSAMEEANVSISQRQKIFNAVESPIAWRNYKKRNRRPFENQ